MSQLSKWTASAGTGTKDLAGGRPAAACADFSTGAARSCGREQSVEVCNMERISAPREESECMKFCQTQGSKGPMGGINKKKRSFFVSLKL